MTVDGQQDETGLNTQHSIQHHSSPHSHVVHFLGLLQLSVFPICLHIRGEESSSANLKKSKLIKMISLPNSPKECFSCCLRWAGSRNPQLLDSDFSFRLLAFFFVLFCWEVLGFGFSQFPQIKGKLERNRPLDPSEANSLSITDLGTLKRG